MLRHATDLPAPHPAGSPRPAPSPQVCTRACLHVQSGVVLGGTAILSAMNGITPHMAGAIDIMVVEQPDGTLKCSPFYGAPRQPARCLAALVGRLAAAGCSLAVAGTAPPPGTHPLPPAPLAPRRGPAVRFGKYTPMRSKDKVVKIIVNGAQCGGAAAGRCPHGAQVYAAMAGGGACWLGLSCPPAPGPPTRLTWDVCMQGTKLASPCILARTDRLTLPQRPRSSSAVRGASGHEQLPGSRRPRDAPSAWRAGSPHGRRVRMHTTLGGHHAVLSAMECHAMAACVCTGMVGSAQHARAGPGGGGGGAAPRAPAPPPPRAPPPGRRPPPPPPAPRHPP